MSFSNYLKIWEIFKDDCTSNVDFLIDSMMCVFQPGIDDSYLGNSGLSLIVLGGGGGGGGDATDA